QERIEFVRGSFEEVFETLPRDFDLIVSNPPYVGVLTQGSLESDVRDFEPPEALYGGEQGHEILERWLPRVSELLNEGGVLVCEIGFDQSNKVKEILAATDLVSEIKVMTDYSGHPRVLTAAKRIKKP